VAIYHLSVKTISRSQGRSATAAAAYRSATEIIDERTGEIHDYQRKSGVEYTELFLPNNAPNWATDRAALWNTAEQAETRKNSTVAREFEIALPSELSENERKKLAITFAKEIVERHGVAADVAIHEPSRGGDNRNHHAHILITTRQLTEEGFTKKTRELDDRKSGEVDRWRERFAELQNESFKKNGVNEIVDHRSLKDQGIERDPSQHLGVTATNYERRTGEPSRRRHDFEKDAADRLKLAKETGELEREVQQLEQSMVMFSDDLKQAKQAKAEVDTKQAWIEYKEKKATEQAAQVQAEIQKEAARNWAIDEQLKAAQAQLAERMREARKEWRQAESDNLLKQAEEKRLQAWALKYNEPSHLLGLFATEKRKKWEFDIQQTIDEHAALKKQAKDTIEGASPQERTHTVQSLIEQKARKLLKNNSPELDQALKDKVTREQQARREQLREERQQQELKRSRSKDQDLER
jgi:ATP-dependent exoDNAse (exonuclease V) alpha subunit